MDPPFSQAEFLDVFGRYNQGVWPAQALFHLLAVLVLWLAWRRPARRDMAISGVLAFLWGWMGIVYHAWYFSRINPAAYLFAGAFVLQAALLLHAGVSGSRPSYRPRMDVAGVAGAAMAAYALVAYPLIGYAVGQRYPRMPTFGLPCPTTIFTLGVLLWATPRLPVRLLLIPTAWAVIASFAAISYGIAEDYALPAAAAVSWGIVARRHRRRVYSLRLRPRFRAGAPSG